MKDRATITTRKNYSSLLVVEIYRFENVWGVGKFLVPNKGGGGARNLIKGGVGGS